jgi:hypothetical protein
MSTSDRETLRRLESEISEGREELGGLVAELDRRRHQFFDLRAQLKRHVVEISLAGATLTAISVAAIWLAVQRAHRRASFVSRASRLGTAVSRTIDNSELVATGPTIPGQLFTAIAAAALGSATRTFVAHAMQSMLDAPRTSRQGRPLSKGIRAFARRWNGQPSRPGDVIAKGDGTATSAGALTSRE